MKYKYIFVVLVYKNISVLSDFFISLNVNDCKVIVVNSFFDEESEKNCSDIAKSYNADYISIPNKGFGYGNNVGSQYAIEHYSFDFLILSNSDIIIENLDILSRYTDKKVIIAPYVHLKSGKLQNPNIPWNHSFLLRLLHLGYINKSNMLLLIAHLFTRASREFFRIYHFMRRSKNYKIFSCHGCFIVFSSNAVYELFPFFDEKMFLYNEELYLAYRAKNHNVSILYDPNVRVCHLEGASSSHNPQTVMGHNLQSFAIVWEKFGSSGINTKK